MKVAKKKKEATADALKSAGAAISDQLARIGRIIVDRKPTCRRDVLSARAWREFTIAVHRAIEDLDGQLGVAPADAERLGATSCCPAKDVALYFPDPPAELFRGTRMCEECQAFAHFVVRFGAFALPKGDEEIPF